MLRLENKKSPDEALAAAGAYGEAEEDETMDNKLETILELSRDPMLAAEDGRLTCVNAAARLAFPGAAAGTPVAEVIPEHILNAQSGRFAAAAAIAGREYTIFSAEYDGARVFSLTPQSAGAERGLLSDGLLANLLSIQANLNLSASRVAAALEERMENGAEPYLTVLRHSVCSMQRQLLNLDAAYRLEEGGMAFFPEQLDLAAYCAGLVDSVALMIRDGRARLSFSSALTELPACVDRKAVRRLLLNLLDNSLAHTPPEGEITVRLEQSGGNAVLSVTDNGEGIPPETMRNIFKRYEQRLYAGQLNRATGGLGLGVASGIAKLHGGALIIESREGHGTSVRATLPLRRDVIEARRPDDLPSDDMLAILVGLSGILDHRHYRKQYFE